MVFRFASFELDEQRAELRGADGAAIKLRPKTFEMLRLFAGNAGRVLSKQELMEAVWPNVHVSEDGLFQCIREIRTALGDDQRQIIKLVSGRGYLFAAEASIEPVGPAASAEAALPVPEPHVDPPANVEAAAEVAKPRRPLFGLRGPAVAAAVASLCAIVGIAVAIAVLRSDSLFKRTPPIIAVMPIVDASDDRQGGAMAAGVTDRLIEGFAEIGNIRVATPRSGVAAASEPASTSSAQSDFVLQGDLQKSEQSWTLRARMLNTVTGEVESVATASVEINVGDLQLQQTRLAAGAGDPLARRMNALLEAGARRAGDAKVVIEQALASINRTTRERFATAQTMLETSLADEPDNADLQVALAALQLRGIMMVWYDPAESAAAEGNARSLLERALRAKPRYIPVLDAYCRFQTATNQFAESLVACARALSFDPWNGAALYNIGLAQIQLGRFEDALATFEQADRFDTPEVSRWTWLLGAGWTSLLMGRNEDAVSWLKRSIAITPASGRSYFLLAVAYQRLGRPDEANAAFAKAMELRPGSTVLNVQPSTVNAGQAYLEASKLVMRTMAEIGLPER
ncbi:tetratricopeptide repeat protein [Aquabacter sp. CN5-332]|uniref:tetratricopeptide repeat protein n=1 Tax=Aquabacter sp. CN5-332 TaxID=3156608 RepID=UPI0032B32A74